MTLAGEPNQQKKETPWRRHPALRAVVWMGLAAAGMLALGEWAGLWRAMERVAAPAGVRVSVAEDGTVKVNGRPLLPGADGALPALLEKLEGAPPQMLDMAEVMKPLFPGGSVPEIYRTPLFSYPRLGLLVQRGDGAGPSARTLSLELYGAGHLIAENLVFRGQLEVRGGVLKGEEDLLPARVRWQDLALPNDTVHADLDSWSFHQGGTRLLLFFSPEGHLRIGYITIEVPKVKK